MSRLNYYKKLIRLRKENPIIVYGGYAPVLPNDEQLFAFKRRFEGISLLVLCNFTNQAVQGIDGLLAEAQDGQLLIANYDGVDAFRGTLAAYEARAILY